MKNSKNPCWKGYEMIGTKSKGSRTVPNCVRENLRMMTFEEYLIDEGFFDSMSQGFKKNYDQSKNDTTGDGQYAQYATKAMEAINKSRQAAGQFSQKLGIDPMLATALMASGVVGGPAAMPMAALLYFVRKPLNKAASAGFDKAANKMGWDGKQAAAQPQAAQPQAAQPQAAQPQAAQPQAAQPQAAQPQAVQPQAVQPQAVQPQAAQPQAAQQSNLWLPGQQKRNPNAKLWTPSSMQNSWNLSFASYANERDLHEGWFGDRVSQAGNWAGKKIGGAEDYATSKAKQGKQWWDNGVSDKVGGAIGNMAGKAAGKTVKGGNMIKSSMSSIGKFASENKLAIGKAAFMVALGAAIGAGVGAGVNSMQSAFDSIASVGVIPQPELQSLQSDLGITTPDNSSPVPTDTTPEATPEATPTGKFMNGREMTPAEVRANDKLMKDIEPWNKVNQGKNDVMNTNGDTQPAWGKNVSQPRVDKPTYGSGDRFWGSHIGEPVPGMESPEVDSSGALPKGRLYPNNDTADPNDYLNGNNDGYNDKQMSDRNAVSDADFDKQDQARRQVARDMGNEDRGPRSREDYAKQDQHAQMQRRHNATKQRIFNKGR